MFSRVAIVQSIAAAFAVGALMYVVVRQTYVFAPARQAVSDDTAPTHPDRTYLGNSNPLKTADPSQFDRWVPRYPTRCGEILYIEKHPLPKKLDFCVEEVSKRVAHSTNVLLSPEDIRDPEVRGRWLNMVKGR